MRALSKCGVGEGIELSSYKRNRGVSILRREAGSFLVRERGYLDQELVAALAELPKLLNGIVKREFPRSRKLRLYRIHSPEELGRERKRL